MKKLIPAILLLSTNSLCSAQTVTWGSPTQVAITMYGNTFPRLVLTTGDNPVVTWGTTGKVYSAMWMGSSFMMPVTLNPSGVTPFMQTWSGAESASSGDTVFVTYTNEPVMTGHVYIVRSVDGGTTYSDTVRVENIGSEMPRFPAVAVGTGGNPVVNFMRVDMGMGTAEYAVSRSMTGGLTFMPDVNASAITPGSVCDCCPGAITTSGNRHAVMYRNANLNIRTIYAAVSTDGCATFPTNTEVDLTNWMIMSCPSSGPSGVIVGDTLITTWMSSGTGSARVYIGTMNINDQQIGVNKQIFPAATGSQNYPMIAAKGDTVAVVWQANVSGSNEVYLSYSLTGAAGIGSTVDTLTAAMTGDQSRPDVEFSNKKLHISYTDDDAGDVKYLAGTMSGFIGVAENKKNSGIQIISATENNGKLDLIISSEIEADGFIQVVSASGAQTSSVPLHVQTGKHAYSVSCNVANGVNYVNLLTAKGTMHGIKIAVVR